MKKKNVIFIAFALLFFCCNDNNNVFIETLDSFFIDQKNWVIYRNANIHSSENNKGGSIDINMFGFQINTTFLIKDSILYLNNSKNVFVKFLDFRLIDCNSYTTINGNKIQLVKYYKADKVDDYFYFYYFKMPYSVADDPYVKDRFMIYASFKKGIIGISDFYKNPTNIELYNYMGNKQLLLDSSFDILCK